LFDYLFGAVDSKLIVWEVYPFRRPQLLITSLMSKRRGFEEQKSKALEKMREINIKLDDLMEKVVEALEKKNLAPLLAGLQQKIFNRYEIEEKAFQILNDVIK